MYKWEVLQKSRQSFVKIPNIVFMTLFFDPLESWNPNVINVVFIKRMELYFRELFLLH